MASEVHVVVKSHLSIAYEGRWHGSTVVVVKKQPLGGGEDKRLTGGCVCVV